MKTRLLKRLRRQAKRYRYIEMCFDLGTGKYVYIIQDKYILEDGWGNDKWDEYTQKFYDLKSAKLAIKEVRRCYIMRIVRRKKINTANRKLKKI